MNWSKLGESLLHMAPTVGAVLGGPVGGSVGLALAKYMGVEGTPESVSKALNSDPNAMVRLREFEAQEMDSRASVQKQMLLSEGASKHTTRPKIAMGAFRLVAFIVILIGSGYFYGVVTGDSEMVGVIIDGWPFVLALLAPMVGWLNAYFGILRKESNDRMGAVHKL